MTISLTLSLVVVASFFQERVETVTAKGGSTVFIQRPKARAEGFTASADDLPDTFDVSNISANSNQLYRVSIGPLDVSLSPRLPIFQAILLF